MEKLNLPPSHPDVHKRIMERISQMTPEEIIAMLEYREPGIPETDMNGDLAAWYREERERREAQKSAALRAHIRENLRCNYRVSERW